MKPLGPILQKIRIIAAAADWVEIDHQANIQMVSFSNGPDRINVYYSKMTVATIIKHPKQGVNQMYRQRVPFDKLAELFKNPRAHLGTGYHEKKALA